MTLTEGDGAAVGVEFPTDGSNNHQYKAVLKSQIVKKIT